MADAAEYSFLHAPLRVRQVPDDPANYEYQAWLAEVYRRTGTNKPFLISGKKSSTPPMVPVLPPPRNWAVETSWRFPVRDEACREWWLEARFVTRDEAVKFCKGWRAAEAWLLEREKRGEGVAPIYGRPMNEMRRLQPRRNHYGNGTW